MPSLFYERLRDAIAVFRGQADAVVWRSKPPPSDKRLTCSCTFASSNVRGTNKMLIITFSVCSPHK